MNGTYGRGWSSWRRNSGLGMLVIRWSCWLLLLSGCGTVTDDPDYRAAEWVLAAGGQVHVSSGGSSLHIQQPSQLPRPPIKLIKVFWEIYPGDKNSRVTDEELTRFEGLPHLQELDLWAAEITDAGLQHVARIPSLIRLQLSQTKVTNAGILQLKEMQQLRQLTLYDTAVTEAGAKKLRRALPRCEVQLEGSSRGRRR